MIQFITNALGYVLAIIAIYALLLVMGGGLSAAEPLLTPFVVAFVVFLLWMGIMGDKIR